MQPQKRGTFQSISPKQELLCPKQPQDCLLFFHGPRQALHYCSRSKEPFQSSRLAHPTIPPPFSPATEECAMTRWVVDWARPPQRALTRETLCSPAPNSCGPSWFSIMAFHYGTLSHIHKPSLSVHSQVGFDWHGAQWLLAQNRVTPAINKHIYLLILRTLMNINRSSEGQSSRNPHLIRF